MKKLMIMATSFTLLSTVHAATSGSLTLRGVVPVVLSISVAPEAVATALPLDVTQSNTKVATINERSNSSTGYSVAISSANAGSLKRVSGTETFSYSMKYNGSSVNLASGQTFSYPSGGVVNQNRDVNISYTGADSSTLVAGTYEDTVTFTISAI